MKNYLNAIIFGCAIIIAAIVFGSAYKARYANGQTISVTGLGEENFQSDLIVWKANFSKTGDDLKQASADLKNDRDRIKNYLISKGVKSDEIVFSAVDIQKMYNYNYDNHGNLMNTYFAGYSLNQSLRIESKEVNKIESISREVTDLINQNIELTSMSPDYYYTKLAELKLKMIENATKDAYERAQKIASNAGSKLGKLKNSSMGVIQINAQNSSEDYSWGGNYNTSSKSKTASITMRLEYAID